MGGFVGGSFILSATLSATSVVMGLLGKKLTMMGRGIHIHPEDSKIKATEKHALLILGALSSALSLVAAGAGLITATSIMPFDFSTKMLIITHSALYALSVLNIIFNLRSYQSELQGDILAELRPFEEERPVEIGLPSYSASSSVTSPPPYHLELGVLPSYKSLFPDPEVVT